MANVKRSGWASFVLIGVCALLVVGGSFFLPNAHGVTDAFRAHIRTAVALLAAVCFTSASIWLLSGVRQFKSNLRRAYALVCIGFTTFSLALLQLPLAGLFNLWNSFWITSGAVIVVFVLTTIVIYIGMRMFARLIQVKHPAGSFWLVTAVTMAFAAATFMASPHLILYKHTPDVVVYLTAVAMGAGYLIASLLLSLRIMRSMGAAYRRAMRWLAITFVGLSVGALHEYFTTYLGDTNNRYAEYGIYLWPFVVTGVLILRAAYEFSLLTREPTIEANQAMPISDHTYIGSITTLANLASNPQAIDAQLEDVRIISARLAANEPLTTNDKTQLLTIYNRIEAYFISGSDPVRTFNKDELRKRLNPDFVALLDTK
ncbi:MAG TPA: hypothetical protein VKQ34_01600 [Candidatus Saccharimonadales bacterium]|nr:hypothetical protein [Candidatus Saccharimonadales bacterium]